MSTTSTQENTAASSAANINIMNPLRHDKISDSEINIGVTVPESVDSTTLDGFKTKASQCFISSREQTYRAIGYAFIWYHVATKNIQYLDKAFQPFAKQTPEARYRNTIKCCLSIAEGERASSVTKYADVLLFIEEALSSKIDLDDTEAFADQVVEVIKSNGGVDAIASPENKGQKPSDKSKRKANSSATPIAGTPSKKPPKTSCKSNEYFDKEIRLYLKRKPIASFQRPASITLADSKLVITISVVTEEQCNVVEAVSDKNLAKKIFKAIVNAKDSSGD